MRKTLCVAVALLGVAAFSGCAAEDPEPTPADDGGAGTGVGGEGGGAGGEGGTGGTGGTRPDCSPFEEDVGACTPAASDYLPRDPAANDAAGDPWPACISDDGTYHEVDPNVSSIARAAAFEELAPLLWDNPGVPSVADFTAAREIYARDQGLDSRVQRRADSHYPPPAAGSCRDAGVPEQNPDHCVGPARILPILNDAFVAGQTGNDPVAQAARIEAALSWFFFVSVYSELDRCREEPKNCDSGWAYYTGGNERAGTSGISTDVDALGPETHDRIFDAILAFRCWRGLEGDATPVDQLTQLALHAAALGQLDPALDRGAALVARTRLQELQCSTGDDRKAAFAFLQTLLPFLDRAAREQGAGHAEALAAVAGAASADAAAAAAPAAIDALESAFDCP